MSAINLLPDSLKHPKPFREKEGGVSFKAPKFFFLILWPLLALFSIIFLALVFQVQNNEKTIAALNQKILNLKSDYRKIETLNARKKELRERLIFYQGIFENKTAWSKKLLLIEKAIPSPVWLTEIYTETKPGRILVIKGSSTSAVESEIIDAISRFTEQLKKENSFSKDFGEIKLGPLLSEKKGRLNVMNFSLVCKFKR